MYDNLLVFGCSYSYGSGFLNASNTTKPKLMSSSLLKDFEGCDTWESAVKRNKEITYGGYIQRKFNIPNYFNYACSGVGIEEMNRRVYSVLSQKKLPKNTIVIYQMPNYNRVELFDSSNYNNNKRNIEALCWETHLPEDFVVNHFIPDFYFVKLLVQYLITIEYIKSFGYFVIPLVLEEHERHFSYKDFDEFIIRRHINDLNQQFPYETISLPSIKSMISEIPNFEIGKMEIPTFASEGIWDDYHWTKDGHDMIGEILSKYIEKYIKKL